MKKFGGSGILRSVHSSQMREFDLLGPDGGSGRGAKMWELGGEGNKLSASACAISDLRAAEDIDEYKAALSKLTREELSLEVDWWKAHLEHDNKQSEAALPGKI